jgi:hypothetical protein
VSQFLELAQLSQAYYMSEVDVRRTGIKALFQVKNSTGVEQAHKLCLGYDFGYSSPK